MTAFDLNAYLRDDSNLKEEFLAYIRAKQKAGIWGEYPRQVRAIRCAAGLELSVQASKTHYCSPQNSFGPWTAVEVGFPNQPIEELLEYAENPDDPTDTVYGWVPVEVVEAVINKHGGLVPTSPALVRYDSPDQVFG